MPNATEAQIKTRIAEFIQELDLLVRKSTLDSLRGILEGGEAPRRRGRPAGSGRPRGSRRGGNVDDAAAKIVAHVRANDGQGISAIADATGVDLKTAKKAAIKLLAEGSLKKSGVRRGTVYHVGSGKKPRAKAGKRKAKRRATRKPAPSRPPKKAVIIPMRKRPASAPKPKAVTDVPQALAVAE